MEKITSLFSSRWDFELYDIGNKLVFTVIFFDQIDYPRSFLFDQESIHISQESLSVLSTEIRGNYEKFKHIEIIPPILL